MMFRPMPGKFKEAKQVYMCGRRQVYLDRYRPIMVCLQGQCHEMFYPTPNTILPLIVLLKYLRIWLRFRGDIQIGSSNFFLPGVHFLA